MQQQRGAAQRQEDHEIIERQGLRLENGLHGWKVDEDQLYRERDRHRRQEHPVLCETTVEPPVLQSGGEVEEHESGESLNERKGSSRSAKTHRKGELTMVWSRLDMLPSLSSYM